MNAPPPSRVDVETWQQRARALLGRPGPAPLQVAVQLVLEYGAGVRAVVLVEGLSDQRAVEAAATRLGRDLTAQGVLVVPMGGVTSIGRFLEAFGPLGLDVRLAGLYDESEVGFVRRGLELVGLGSGLDSAGLSGLGFEVCVGDLEEELVCLLTPAGAEQVISEQGDLSAIRYAPLFVQALDPEALPQPLVDLLDHLEADGPQS